jgi:hypothetical protein
VRLAKFSEETSADMRKALQELTEGGMRALILDMRFNTGGLLREAIEVSELFVPKGEMIVSTKGRMTSQNREYKSEKEPLARVPVFVLVNEGTASASEIVAGAIQDHHLGVVIGPEVEGEIKNTFGKGSVQTIGELRHSLAMDEDGNELPNALRLTTAKYYTPSGKSIHNIGIKPDIAVAVPKGFQAELIRHGMIGDPSQVEPGHNGIHPENGNEIETAPEPESRIEEELHDETIPESPENPEAAPTPDPEFYLKDLQGTDAEPPAAEEDFHDIMLDEAIRQMKVYLILQTAQGQQEGREPLSERVRAEMSAETGAEPKPVAP